MRRILLLLLAISFTAAAQFYAHLYVGLYAEALGNKRLASERITAAAAERFAAAGGYMHRVAKAHLELLQRQ